MVNEQKDYDREFPPGYVNAHGVGAACYASPPRPGTTAGNAPSPPPTRRSASSSAPRPRTRDPRGDYRLIDSAVAAAGLPASLWAGDEGYDVVLREAELALARTGKDVGTPIITFSPGGEDEVSFFGPVIARIREARRRRRCGTPSSSSPGRGFAEDQAVRPGPPGVRLVEESASGRA